MGEIKSFDVLSQVDISKLIEKNQGSKYLSWSHAISHVLKKFPDMTYTILKNENGLPYFIDDSGAMVYTTVTIEGITREMWLPVLDCAFKTMKKQSYKYRTKKGEKYCEAIDSFAVNKTVMRCLTKNLAMFGMGINLYAGEDLPLDLEDYITTEQENLIKKLYKENELTPEKFSKLLTSFGVKHLQELRFEKANELIKELKELKKV